MIEGRRTHSLLQKLVTKPKSTDWHRQDSQVLARIESHVHRTLGAYSAQPMLVQEHANIERSAAQGGYGRRQIYELVQNGADAMQSSSGGRIAVVLTASALYCANQGEPIDERGVDAILSSHVSAKRGSEIGRFGLGFKSVLGVSSNPEFYSRSGSFAFNSRRSAERIHEVVPTASLSPTLRMAWPLNVDWEFTKDSVLSELCSWATTVVKLPRDRDTTDWLSEDLANFPAEFPLFSPHIGTVTLEDRTKDLKRNITVKTEQDGEIILSDSGQESRWKVFSSVHKPSDSARKEAGELADRDELPLIWAVPLTGRVRRGEFWAFFPTHYKTTLSGILNAPWKTNEDRQNLLAGGFNEELLDSAARLIIQSLPQLCRLEDPGWYLEQLPARGREAPNWADERLTSTAYLLAGYSPSLPDQNGVLRYPREIKFHPQSLSELALSEWSGCSERPSEWVHHSVETPQRRSRAERIFASAGSIRRPATAVEWLEALLDGEKIAGSISAVRIAAEILESVALHAPLVKQARIVLTDEWDLVPPYPGTVFVPSMLPNDVSVTLVNSAVVSDQLAVKALQRLGITEQDAESPLEALLKTGIGNSNDANQWTKFWKLVEALPSERAVELLKDHLGVFGRKGLHAKTRAGHFRPLAQCLLPGPVVAAEGAHDHEIAIDTQFHVSHLSVLKAMGAASEPRRNGAFPDEHCIRQYLYAAREAYVKRSGRRPRDTYLVFRDIATAGPLDILMELSPEAKAKYTSLLLALTAVEAKWVVTYIGQSRAYDDMDFFPASAWVAQQYGMLPTSLGVRKTTDCFGRGLANLGALLPVVDSGLIVPDDLLPNSASELNMQTWKSMLSRAKEVEDPKVLGEAYAAAARHLPEPSKITCVGPQGTRLLPPNEVVVAEQGVDESTVRELELTYVVVPTLEDVQTLSDRWGLIPADQAVAVEMVYLDESDPIPLIDVFPGLFAVLADDQVDTELIYCGHLYRESLSTHGKSSAEVEFSYLRSSGRLYVKDGVSSEALLHHVSRVFRLSLDQVTLTEIVEQRAQIDLRNRISDIRSAPDLESRVLRLFDEDALMRRLPSGLLAATDDIYDRIDSHKLVRMALAVYGVDLLKVFRSELEASGLQPPIQWAGSHAAREFVVNLGFPLEFAGLSIERRQPYMDVDGPSRLPPMHDFQREIADRIERLLDSDRDRRGVVSLPTGAGKTRVAVQALVETLERWGPGNPILWIAQSDELCEQAVATWRYVWQAIGPQSQLRISRLWGSNESEPMSPDDFHVVVATIQKLQNCVTDPTYGWLAEARVVLIDEAHGSIAQSYTRVLQWLGLGRGRDRCPLIGLTATPFRGNEEETTRLVRRYEGKRLDENVLGEDPYRELQQMGVLANVEQRVLKGEDFVLSEQELERLRKLRTLPASAESRLGENIDRNLTILNSIKSLPLDWPVLLFATSVDHAQTMAALLAADGISAACISANTDPGMRRHSINEFRNGRLRVLTNYSVLTAGFDAPAVRAIYVTRPIYTPVIYQQMIGRGLRGPQNGGKSHCLIVNIQDNLAQFGEELAFTRFEHLWNPQ